MRVRGPRHGRRHACRACSPLPNFSPAVKPAHRKPEGARDSVALSAVKLARGAFDVVTGYNSTGNNSEAHWLRRVIFLETVAGVPGMVAAMLRHMASLRNMEPDNGWIHTLLEEAENERMHLLTFIEIQKASWALCVGRS